MPEPHVKSWRTLRGERPLNEARVEAYKRLADAETLLAQSRERHGISRAAITQALEDSEPTNAEDEPDLYLRTLLRYVAALGGQLEVRAVFPEETITLLHEPQTADDSRIE
jgi:hypothetical protein